MNQIDTFIKLLEKGQDNALLRYSLGNEYIKVKEFMDAITHLEKAIEFNPTYSAAWKLYAKALTESEQIEAAMDAYQKGIVVAEENGDKQAAKEMQVFLKRLQKS